MTQFRANLLYNPGETSVTLHFTLPDSDLAYALARALDGGLRRAHLDVRLGEYQGRTEERTN